LFADYPLYLQENEDDPLVIAKLFDPCGSATWFLLEFDRLEKIAFGFVVGLAKDELDYINLTEMEEVEQGEGVVAEVNLPPFLGEPLL